MGKTIAEFPRQDPNRPSVTVRDTSDGSAIGDVIQHFSGHDRYYVKDGDRTVSSSNVRGEAVKDAATRANQK